MVKHAILSSALLLLATSTAVAAPKEENTKVIRSHSGGSAMAHTIEIEAEESEKLPTRARMADEAKSLEKKSNDAASSIKHMTRTRTGGSGTAHKISIPSKE